MASLRDIRRKIKSIKNTQQITKAMKMVAAARLRKAQNRIVSARRFADKMEQLMTDLLLRIEGEEAHPIFQRTAGPRRALLLVTSDKGLCGAFNTNLIREALKYIRKFQAENVQLYIVGRKGRDYFRRTGLAVAKEYVNIFNNLGYEHAEIIAIDLAEEFLQKRVVAVDMLYNEFKSVVSQKVIVKQLLPLSPISAPVEEMYSDFIYEPAKEKLLEALIPRFLKTQVFRVLLESAAAELGARMSAMENATENAAELMESLTLTLNRTRQSSITTEILEVVSGAEALK